jgi:ABC-type transport system substrate-binding protein
MPKGETAVRKDGDKFTMYKDGGKVKSRVNEAGNYTKPGMRKSIFERIKAGGKGGAPGQWSARKAQMLAQQYKKAGGGYRD